MLEQQVERIGKALNCPEHKKLKRCLERGSDPDERMAA